MLKRNYNKGLALGCIGGAAGLGVLIPPSINLIIYGQLAGESVGKLFMAGILPGLMISLTFMSYIGLVTFLRPGLGPALPPEERVDWRKKISSLVHISIPIGLVILVLGTIFTGAATPTEAASVGALGSMVAAAIYRKLSFQNFKEACYGTLRVTATIMWIMVGAYAFTSVYQALGAIDLIKSIISALPVNRYIILIGMQIILLIMGCFLDTIGILMITGPVFIPLAKYFDFNLVWFGILYVVNLEIGFITPPFGINLFYLRGVAGDDITTLEIYRGMVPFILLYLLGLAIIMIFPEIPLWLPNKMMK
jgi:tripartite ATP-independent transporter DctM subunit